VRWPEYPAPLDLTGVSTTPSVSMLADMMDEVGVVRREIKGFVVKRGRDEVV
jgi:hypothetical protein